MKLTEVQKQREVRKQLDGMVKDVRKALDKKLSAAMRSGAIPDDYFEGDSYLLAKAVFDSWCRERQYRGLNSRTDKEFTNLHTCI